MSRPHPVTVVLFILMWGFTVGVLYQEGPKVIEKPFKPLDPPMLIARR